MGSLTVSQGNLSFCQTSLTAAAELFTQQNSPPMYSAEKKLYSLNCLDAAEERVNLTMRLHVASQASCRYDLGKLMGASVTFCSLRDLTHADTTGGSSAKPVWNSSFAPRWNITGTLYSANIFAIMDFRAEQGHYPTISRIQFDTSYSSVWKERNLSRQSFYHERLWGSAGK